MTRDFEAEKNKLLTEVIELRRINADLSRIVSMVISHTSRTEKNIKSEGRIALERGRTWLEQNGKG